MDTHKKYLSDSDIIDIFRNADLETFSVNDGIHEIYESQNQTVHISIGISLENQSDDPDLPETGYIINLFYNQQYENFPGFYSKHQLFHDASLHHALAETWNQCWNMS